MIKLDYSILDEIYSTDKRPSSDEIRKPAAITDFESTDLQRRADNNQKILEQAAEIGRIYHDNIRTAETRKTEILKGVQAGEDIYLLFLKAVELIGALTDDTVMYPQIERDLTTVYGYGMLEQGPLENKRKSLSECVQRLNESVIREKDENTKKRLINAINEQQRKIQEIDILIEKSKLQE